MLALGRLLTCCALGALAWLPISAALAADPSWYADVQYLTWDVRADEAEAARATGSNGEVYLKPSESQRECGWYESCRSGKSRRAAVVVLPQQIVGAFQKMVGKGASMGRAMVPWREADGVDAGIADTSRALRVAAQPVAISRKLER